MLVFKGTWGLGACGRVCSCIRGCGLVDETVALWTDGVLLTKGGVVDEAEVFMDSWGFV